MSTFVADLSTFVGERSAFATEWPAFATGRPAFVTGRSAFVTGRSTWSDAAVALAARLASLAQPDATGAPSWEGDDLDPSDLTAGSPQPRVVTGLLDEGFLTGRSGIALTLAVCAGLPGADSYWAELARRAAHASVQATAATLPSGPLGWDSGALGVAWASSAVAAATGDEELGEASERLGEAALHTLLDGTTPLPPWPDLIGGIAGVLLGVVRTPLPCDAEPLRREAISLLINRLASMSIKDAAGVRWPMATMTTAVAGLAHGASGIAWTLRLAARALADDPAAQPITDGASSRPHASQPTPRVLAYAPAPRPHASQPTPQEYGAGASHLRLVSGDPDRLVVARARRMVDEALRWEFGIVDPATGGWPDLRSSERPPALAWCNGAPGIGLLAARTAALEPGGRVAQQAHATYLRAARAAEAHRPNGKSFDGTLCHGLAGVVAMHLAAAEAWPQAANEHLRAARQVASHLVRAGQPGAPRWTCGVPGGRTPNVLVGIAGVALVLAHCHDLRTPVSCGLGA